MADLGNIITSFFGTTFEFYNIFMNTAAKVFRGISLAYRFLVSDSFILLYFLLPRLPSLSTLVQTRGHG